MHHTRLSLFDQHTGKEHCKSGSCLSGSDYVLFILMGLLILEAIWLGRKRKKIWLFFRLEPFTPAVCPAFHDLIVVLIIQLHQSGIELSYRGEGLMVMHGCSSNDTLDLQGFQPLLLSRGLPERHESRSVL